MNCSAVSGAAAAAAILFALFVRVESAVRRLVAATASPAAASAAFSVGRSRLRVAAGRSCDHRGRNGAWKDRSGHCMHCGLPTVPVSYSREPSTP